jgi:hypothetical protein
MSRDLLREAIADAKAVRESAIANAKAALEEAFTPHLKNVLAEKIKELDEEEDVKEGYSEKDRVDEEDAVSFRRKNSPSYNMDPDGGPVNPVPHKAGKSTVEENEVEENQIAEEEDVKEGQYEVEEELSLEELLSEEEGEEEVETEETEVEDEEAETEDEDEEAEIDLEDMTEEDLTKFVEEVIKDMVEAGELEAGEAAEEEEVLEAAHDDKVEEGYHDKMEEGAHEEVEEGMDKDKMEEELSDADVEKVDKEVDAVRDDLDQIAKLAKDAGEDAEDIKDVIDEEAKEKELAEAYQVISKLRKDLNEVNLLNSKLLYTNKIFRNKNLNESQKVKVLNSFDKAETVKEVKLVFESLSSTLTAKKSNIKESMGFASKPTGKAPINESAPVVQEDAMVARFKKLAGL